MNTDIEAIPQTIEELKIWYQARALPPADITRLFIDCDYDGICAYGIYKKTSNDEFVVYKNKPDGSRYVRYSGTNETEAVKEFYYKMIDELSIQDRINAEIAEEKQKEQQEHIMLKYMIRDKYNTNQSTGLLLIIAIVVIMVVAGVFYIATSKSRRYRNNYNYAINYLQDKN